MKTLTGVLALGVKIADDIGANDDCNTTGKWIAHHLAEKLEAAKKDPTLEDECVDLILKLWASRRYFPSGDPLAQYDRLLPVVEKLLGLEQRFFRGDHTNISTENPGEKWLQAALRLDQLSTVLIAEFLRKGVREMTGSDEGILTLAEAIECTSRTQVVRIITKHEAEEEIDSECTKDPIPQLLENLKEFLNELSEKQK